MPVSKFPFEFNEFHTIKFSPIPRNETVISVKICDIRFVARNTNEGRIYDTNNFSVTEII